MPATYQALRSKLYAPTQRMSYVRNASSASTGTAQDSALNSEWISTGTPDQGATPTTAAVCDRTTQGALGQANASAGSLRAFLERFDLPYPTSSSGGMLMLVDRLAHNGGLSGTSIAAQSNGAWPALTRYTTGLDVWAAIEIYGTIGSTQTTITMDYTDDGGTAGQVSQPVKIGATGRSAQRRLLPMSLASGDRGVRAVASVTLAATTGTIGNFGVTLFRTLGAWPINSGVFPYALSGRPFPGMCGMPKVEADACLQLIYLGGGNAGSNIAGGVVSLFES